MAESRSDFIKDENIIREEMEKLKEHLSVQRGFNADSNVFEIGKDANGDVLILKSTIDTVRDLPAGWTYGTYYLDGYPKTGFYTMKDGKYMFLPSKNEIDKSKEVEYKTVQDFKNALVAENQHLANQVSITSGFGAEGVIQIEGDLNGVNLPTTDLYFDEAKGAIVSSINPGIQFRVEFVRSMEVNNDTAVRDGADSSVNSSLDMSAIKSDESVATRGESEGKGVSVAEYGPSILDFSLMKYVFDNYEFGHDNNVVSREKDGTRYKIDEGRTANIEEDPRRIEAVLKLNKIWIDSYHSVLEGAGRENAENETAFMGEATAATFNVVMEGLVKNGNNLKMSEIPQLFFDKFGYEQSGLVKVIMYFISNPELSTMFSIEMDMGPEAAIAQIDMLKEKDLKQRAEEMFEERENEDVMEMIRKPNNIGNGSIQ